jgi:hypothetical protein
MACERYKARLIDEALAPGADPELSAHLPGCVDCRSELSRQRELQSRISGSIAAMVSAEPSPAFLARVRQQIDLEESQRHAGWLQWAVGGVAVAALAGFAIWFAGRALLRQSAPGPQPGQIAGGTPTPQTSTQNQPAQNSTASPTGPANVSAPVAVRKNDEHRVKSARRTTPRAAQSIQVAAANRSAPATNPQAASAQRFNVIVPAGQREAVLRLVAAMNSGRVNVAGLLKQTEQEELAPLEIAPLKIAPLEDQKNVVKADGSQQ